MTSASAIYTISLLGRLAGVSRSTLLYYDSIGLLSPSSRTAAGYRLYNEAQKERLLKIVLFHSLGISLKRIHALLDSPETGPAAVLIRRMVEINDQIQDLRDKQQAIIGLIEEEGTLTGAKNRLRKFTALGRRAGIDKGNYLTVHRLFEKSSPDLHRKLLQLLGFTEREIKELKKRIAATR